MSLGMLINDIMDGAHDGDLDTLREAINTRRKEIQRREATVNALTIKPGSRVRLKGLSPKYLNGLEGEVKADPRARRGKTRIAVKLDTPSHRYGSTVHVPANCVEAL